VDQITLYVFLNKSNSRYILSKEYDCGSVNSEGRGTLLCGEMLWAAAVSYLVQSENCLNRQESSLSHRAES
jgi:hypothetical protein